MRSSFGFGGLFLFLAGCSTPSCDFQLSCRNDYDCGIAQICQSSFLLNACEDVLLCDGNPCPAGEECIQREGAPPGNPFEDALPGKHVCQGPTVVGPGGTGGGGTGGSTGGSTGGAPTCNTGVTEGEILGVQSAGTPAPESRPFLSAHSNGSVFYSYSFGTQSPDAGFVLSLRSPDGSAEWSQTVTADGAPSLLAQTSLGNGAAAAASFTGALTLGDATLDSGSGSAVALFRIRTDGSLFSQQAIVSDDMVTVSALTRARFDNRVTIAGTFRGTLKIGDEILVSSGGVDGFVAVLDLGTGKAVWTTRLGGAGDQEVTALAFDESTHETFAGGNFVGQIVLAANPITADATDAFVAKLDPESGALLEGRVITGPDRQVVTALALPGKAALLVAGARTSESQSSGSIDFGDGLQLDAEGLVDGYLISVPSAHLETVTWAALYGGPAGTGEVIPRALAIDCAGDAILVGSAGDGATLDDGDPLPGAGGRDAFALKLHPGLELPLPVWAHVYGGPDDDEALAVLPRSSDSIWIAGTYRDSATFGDLVLTSKGADDLFLLQVTP